MKKKTLAVLSAAVMAAAFMAGCSNNKAAETTAPATTEAEPQTEAVKENTKAQLVIAGSDSAGLLAAVQAVSEGLEPSKILILQTEDELGADLASMDFFVNASNTDEQYDQDIEDSFEQYLADTKKAGNEKNNEELAEALTENGEEALTWIRDNGIEVEGVTKQEGSSIARSYAATGDQKLNEALSAFLLNKIEELKIPVEKAVTVDELLFDKEGNVSGLKVTGAGGEETIDCLAVIAADKKLLPLFKTLPVTFTENESGEQTGLLINNCSEVLGKEGTSIPGLYAVGAITDAGIHGEKALAGNQITGTVYFGLTAGIESAIYTSDMK